MNLASLLPLALAAAEKACDEILTVYRSGDFQAEAKGDNSPLTLADKKAHEAISHLLSPSSPFPILSEEGKNIPYADRKNWDYFWMVDPLDGTKEFLKRNDEFTVNIALIHQGRPVLGVVAVPVTGDVFYGAEGHGAFVKRNGQTMPIARRPAADLKQPNLKVIASRSHLSPETEAFINTLTQPALVSAGSSLKFMLLAEGKADVYPRHAPTMEWDTAAADAIVREAGLQVRLADGAGVLSYNKENLLNPYFLAY
ncbi:3'(2'),5'-bisphosphate nucleotidase CysQ [Chryseolinea lacunae]|uniref:3'(2'),5'-bisphosphate nucleotidase CysQ n=1 Tax=Chryseolinea lacunae TaxID=2801331 RepID=A0ABS1KXW5_9BACT|nr:3'(2'),5'-bisphosphate nucleotidase CysQ [Chryseolinea lacunae]MBL0744043.1 3'(2'),5'-bisphosphate nucleotidase CysQ [Chryseolinea lacunae]